MVLMNNKIVVLNLIKGAIHKLRWQASVEGHHMSTWRRERFMMGLTTGVEKCQHLVAKGKGGVKIVKVLSALIMDGPKENSRINF